MGKGPKVLRKRAGYQSCVAHAQASVGGAGLTHGLKATLSLGVSN